MRRHRRRYDIYFVIFMLAITVAYFTYSSISSEERGVKAYSQALDIYKKFDYELAYQEFAKVPSNSSLKISALFRQARCATNLGKKELAIKKYKRIVRSNSKSSIVPISEYNMAYLMFELKDDKAQKYFIDITKKYPTSDYAIAAQYYLGLIKIDNLPNNEKKMKKAKEEAFINFKNYIEKAPSGRFSLNSVEEINKLDIKLKNYENLLIAKVYYENGYYDKAQEFLNKTTLSESWTDFVKNEYKLGNYDKVKYYTAYGLKDYAATSNPKDVYIAIDNFIATYQTRREGINSLVNAGYNSIGADYISYLNCSEIVSSNYKEACFRTLYEKYPNGQFSADSLFNIFISKYLQKKYLDAQKIGFLHMEKFPNVNSSPAVVYFMGKIAYKLKHYEKAKEYYKQVLSKHPDSYYAYRANYNLFKDDGILPFAEIQSKPVVFPYKKSLENNLVIKLALLKDYDLVEELCKKDKFIQSWIAYQKGNYTISAVLARKAMEEKEIKPSFDDLRWRLVYPLHYYNIVKQINGNNNDIIIQSIIKEESHFNPMAKSIVGASGLMQLMPATYSEISKINENQGDIFEAESNIMAGYNYYSRLKRDLNNKDVYAISAYNAGIGSVKNWIKNLLYTDFDEYVEQIPYSETKNYVKKIFRSYWMYGNIY